MLEPAEANKRWKFLTECLNKIRDESLKKSMYEYYRSLAVQEWGYCPDGKKTDVKTVAVEDWAKPIFDKIATAKTYGVWEKDVKVEVETINRMSEYIEKGGKFSDLPEDLQNTEIAKLYIDIMLNKIHDCENFLFT